MKKGSAKFIRNSETNWKIAKDSIVKREENQLDKLKCLIKKEKEVFKKMKVVIQ